MDHIGAAILLAEPVVGRAGVQQHGSAITQRVGNFQQRIRRKVGDDEAIAAGEVRCRLGGVLTVLEPDFLQGETLIEELSGRVVVLDREARAGNAVVLRGLFDQGQFRFDAGLTEIADTDLERVGRDGMGRHEAQADRADQPSDHGSSLMLPALTGGDGAAPLQGH